MIWIIAAVFWGVAGLFLVNHLGPRVSRHGKRWEEIGLSCAAGPIVWLIMVVLWLVNALQQRRWK